MLGLTVPHYVDFGPDRAAVGDTLDAAAWDALRTQTDGVYSLPASREGLERKALGLGAWVRRAEAIDALLRARNAHSVASYGAGAGIIELLLLRLSPARSMD